MYNIFRVRLDAILSSVAVDYRLNVSDEHWSEEDEISIGDLRDQSERSEASLGWSDKCIVDVWKLNVWKLQNFEMKCFVGIKLD